MLPASLIANYGKIKLVLAVLATCGVISVSLGNPIQTDLFNFEFLPADKVGHAFAYLVLGSLWMIYFASMEVLSIFQKVTWQKLLIVLFLLGVLLEILQWGFYPNRYFEFGDMIANGIGAFLGTFGLKRIFTFNN